MRRVLVAGSLVLAACPLGGRTGDPCLDDANGCEAGGALEIDPTCERVDPLQLELGDGDGEFRPLAPGSGPELVSGLQGGVHMVLGVGVDNPSEDHLAFEIEVMLSADDDGERVVLGERTAIYDGPVVAFDAGRAELLDLVVIPDAWPSEGRRWISVTATDACGRMGTLDHAVDQ